MSKRSRRWIWIALLLVAFLILKLSVGTDEDLYEALQQTESQR